MFPRSRCRDQLRGDLLKSLVEDADIANLKYFRVTKGRIAGVPVEISRTGYTGDLGYEIWIAVGASSQGLGRIDGRRDALLIFIPPECWRSTSRASKPDCC